MSSPGNGSDGRLSHAAGALLPIVLVASILALVVPFPSDLLDMLLVANVTAAVLILLQTVRIGRPGDFTAFPTLLLTTTLVRLVLNVASTRLILTDAPQTGLEAAGAVIASFGEFVAGGSPVVGLVIFGILIAIQFLVITKGASRIGEVAARFTLDALPGKQAAIDAELGGGLITLEEARRRRDELSEQADFYGAMDGASRFVRGDAIAGLVIIGINLVGGIVLGVTGHGLSLAEAASLFAVLTIGDGLVSQIPALLISLASGVIVTRSSRESDLSRDVLRQMFGDPTPLIIAAVFLAAMGLCGFPPVATFGLAAACAALAFWMWSASEHDETTDAVAGGNDAQVPQAAPAPARSATTLEERLHVEPLQLDLGVSLVRLADRSAGGDLLDRVAALRDRIVAELGFVLPKVRIQDDLRLDPREFAVRLRGVAVARGTVYADSLFAVDEGFVGETLAGVSSIEPATGKPGVWIAPEMAESAREAGYRLIEPGTYVLQVLGAAVRQHASELLSREHVHELLAHLRVRSPRLVDELIPHRLSGGQIHQVLSALLQEQVPIRDLETILSTLSILVGDNDSLESLVAGIRLALRRTILDQYVDSNGVLHCVMLDVSPEVAAGWAAASEARLCRSASSPGRDEWLVRLDEALKRLIGGDHRPVVVCHSEFRSALWQLLQSVGMNATVLGHREIPAEQQLRLHAEMSAEALTSPGGRIHSNPASTPEPVSR